MTTDEGQESSSVAKRPKIDENSDSLRFTLSEADVGISEYMFKKNDGFKGTLKGRHVTKFW